MTDHNINFQDLHTFQQPNEPAAKPNTVKLKHEAIAAVINMVKTGQIGYVEFTKADGSLRKMSFSCISAAQKAEFVGRPRYNAADVNASVVRDIAIKSHHNIRTIKWDRIKYLCVNSFSVGTKA